MSAFVAVAEAGGFSAAARISRTPLATISRKVAELEAHLNVSLINRSTRRITLTETGQSYYASCRRLLDEMRETERVASGEYRAPRGELIISAPTLFGSLHLTPIVVEFQRQFPDVKMRLMLTNQVIDLINDHVDLAVRISELPDSSLVAQRVGTIRTVICASPAYLAERGSPQQPDDLARHDCITRTTQPTPDYWPFRVDGRVYTVQVPRRLTASTSEAVIEAAIAGAGLTRVLCYQIAKAEKAGELVKVLEEFEAVPVPISLVYPASRLVPMKLRAFLDFAVPRLRQRLTM